MNVTLYMIMNYNRCYEELKNIRENDRENDTVAKLIFLEIKSDHA